MAVAEDDDMDIKIPKEHGHLDYLLSQIPKKAQKGMLMQCDLNLLSLDANENFIALGSNVGVIFLYNRKSKELERLRTHSHNDVIIFLALHSGLEQQVAAATEKGVVYLFQLPSKLPSHSKQLQQFVVKDVHRCEVTCLCWSMNGMKLFTGDKKGQVSCVEVDFYAGVCETNICLIENNSEIVQLNHAHKALLISTNQRTVIYRTDIQTGMVQVGQKERKIFGKFGAIFLPGLCKPEDAELYACRPSLRIWKSKMDGSVQNTYLFKELINNPHPNLELLPFRHKSKMFLPESQFGPIYLYKEKYIVTWHESSLFLLNPLNTSVICGSFHVGNIKTVAVTNDEIFVLRMGTDRNVIRLGERPESLAGSTYHRLVKDNNMPDFVKEQQVKEETAQSTPSPLRFLKENVVDKLKNIELTSERTSSVTNLAFVVEKHSDHYGEKPTAEKDLPPVIKLDKVDLLTVEIFSGSPPMENDDNVSPMRQGRFNPFMKEDSYDDNAEVDTSALATKVGLNSRQISQDSSNQSEIVDSGTFSLQSSFSSHEVPVEKTTTKHDAMKLRTTPGHHGNSPDSLSRIQAIPIITPGDDIAVSVKTKKKKKKKKDPNKLSANIDSDTLSQNSFEGETFDSEESNGTSELPKKESTDVDISDIVGLKPRKSDTVIAKMESEESLGSLTQKQEDCEDANSLNENKTENYLGKTSEGGSEVCPPVITQKEGEPQLGCRQSLPKHDGQSSNNETSQVKGDKPLPPNSDSSIREPPQSPKSASPMLEQKLLPEIKLVSTHSNDSDHAAKSTVHSLFTQHDNHNADIAEKVPIHSKKNKSFSKLEKNLAHLEEGLNLFGSSTSVSEKKGGEMHQNIDSVVTKINSENDSENSSMLNLSSVESESDKGLESPRQESSSVKSPVSPITDNIYKTGSGSCDDFYSKYNIPTPSQSVNNLKEITEHPLSGINALSDPQDKFDDKTESVHVCDQETAMKSKSMLNLNNWTEVYMSGNLQSLAISDTHVWCTDKSSNIWYCSLKSVGIKWTKATGGYAKQISVSRSGMIVWRLYKDIVYAGTKITSKHPEGMKWVEAVKDVRTIAVDNNCAWYIKTNGDVAIQKGLSKDRPCYKSTLVEQSSYIINFIVCRAGVVWAITDQCKLIYRAGIKKNCPEGKEWAEYTHPDGMMFSSVSLGDGNVAWAVDILGRIYFMTRVSMETPIGDSCWWQVPVHTEVAVTDYTLVNTIKSMAKVFDPQKLAHLISSQKGGLIASGADGIWMCPEFKNTLLVCKSSFEGHFWNEIHLSGIAASTAWKLISVTALHMEWGLIWVQQPNGEIFTFTAAKRSVKTVEPPQRGQFICLSVCEEAAWGLHENGNVFIRDGVAEHCPEGAKWFDLDLKQLGDAQLVHLSCGARNVWAVDSDGVVYQRIGVRAPSTHSLQAAWLPVDSGPSGTTFLQVYNGPTDTMVWAVDNRRQTYVRLGVTDEMPIGTSWLHIPGNQVLQLAISDNFVWALDPNGEIMCRHGITTTNPGGDYWRKIPGVFNQISCSKSDELWAINSDGLIFCRRTKYLIRKDFSQDAQRQRKSSSTSLAEDWELV